MERKTIRKIFFILLLFLAMAFLFIPLALRAGGDGQYSQLPYKGENFTAYGLAPYLTGRCYLLTPVREIVTEAYAELEADFPGREFVYLEMGWNGGGPFAPHKTHREGRSADFLTPMRNKDSGLPDNLPIGMANRWGYDLRLSAAGEYGDLVMDGSAVIRHLAALEKSAARRGWRIARVIFDPPLLARLRKSAEYSLVRNLPFMKGRAWFPHDGHYHVDFAQNKKRAAAP